MQTKLILSFLTLLFLTFLVPSDVFGDWYDTSWDHRNKITVSLNTVTSSDLSDFPVLISLTDSDFTQANSDGSDFVFTSSDGTTVLDHEIEKFDSSTGELIVWVNFPTLPSSSNTDIYIYYEGDTSSVNSEDVWNDDYVVVWHLSQTSTGASGEFQDSTSNGNDGRGGGGTDVGHDSQRIPHITDGQIGNGQHLKGPTTTGNGEGTGDIIYRNSLDGMPSRDFTIELWTADITNVPTGGNPALYNDLVSVCHDGASTKSKWQNHISLWQAENVKMKIRTSFFVSTTYAAGGHSVADDNPAAFTNWNHIVAVYNQKDADGTQGNSQLYINGVLVKDQNRSGHLNRNIQTDNLRMVLGGDIDAQGGNNCGRVNNELKGKVDEFRISSGLRTADYAAASYHNQGNPSGYLTLATQETVDTTSPATIITSTSGSTGSTIADTTLNYTVTFSESVSNFAVGDITVTGSANGGSPAARNFAGSGVTYTFDVVKGSSDGTVVVSVAAGTTNDAAGNDNTVSNTYTLTIDTVNPTITISSTTSCGSTIADTTLNYTVTFSESVSNFTIGDITVTGTANSGSPVASNFAGSGTTYTFDAVRGSSDGTVVVSVAAGTSNDVSNNSNIASNTCTFTVDTVHPIPIITSSTDSNGSTVSALILNYTVTFSKSVSDFAVGDITVTGTANSGSPVASNFAGSGTTYTFDVVKGSSDGKVVVSVAANTITDSSDNDNLASNVYTMIIDTGTSSDCYDCEPPKLTRVEVHVTSNNSDNLNDDSLPLISETRDYVWIVDTSTELPVFGNHMTPIIADPGDEVEIVMVITDNRTLKQFIDVGSYTNFKDRPVDMNLFYANNFDNLGKVSTTFYEWNQNGDDLIYDYSESVKWQPADVTIDEYFDSENDSLKNDDYLIGFFTISFKIKFLQPMDTTELWVQATDGSANSFKVPLPLTLKITGNEPLVFESKVNQKVLSFYDEQKFIEIVSVWSGSSQDVSQLASLLGISDQELPPWVANLALWVSENKITAGDMIVSIEHLINN
ncbi:MAG: DUF2341 domain-containing protein [Nitrosopumilus sp.]|nr:DUF2341 domain-containing protein [Nitrosopumilus sp.]